MPAALASEFLAKYPEFGMFAVELIQSWLDDCEAMHCPAVAWKDPIRQRTGVMLRTAHYLEVQRQQIAQSASMGAAVSVGQMVSSSGGQFDDLDQTSYGRQFKQLKATIPRTGFVF